MNCQFTTLERIPNPNPNHTNGVLTIKLSYHYFLCTTPDPDIIWILVDAIFYRITYITMYSLSNETEMII